MVPLLRQLLLLLGWSLLAPSVPAQQACVFQGLNAAPFGVSTRLTTLVIQWNSGACSIETEVSAPVCCGAVLVGHALVLGDSPLAVPILLPTPYFPGSYLYVSPDLVLGPTSTQKKSYTLPPDPALAARTFFAQGVAIIYDPGTKQAELGISQGMITQLVL